jgi:2'-5' RNA ligase
MAWSHRSVSPVTGAGVDGVTLRMFVAVTPPVEAVAHLDARLQRERRVLAGRLPEDLRWIPAERWHLTLAFVGEVPVEIATVATAVLRDVLAHEKPASVALVGCGSFGGTVLHVPVLGRNGALQELAARTREVLGSVGIATDGRPFRPHVTIGRLRRPAPGARRVIAALADYVGPEWTVDRIDVVQSLQGPEPQYRTLSTSIVGAGG